MSSDRFEVFNFLKFTNLQKPIRHKIEKIQISKFMTKLVTNQLF